MCSLIKEECSLSVILASQPMYIVQINQFCLIVIEIVTSISTV